MVPCTLYRRAETLNALNEAVEAWQEAGTVRAALSEGGGSLNQLNQLRRVDSTHTAVTWDSVKPGEAIAPEGAAEVYLVTYAIDGGGRRMNQLFLKREQAEEEPCASP